jgi:hypothetical protein
MFGSCLFLFFMLGFSSQRPELNFKDLEKLYCKEDILVVGEYRIECKLTGQAVPEIRLSRKGKLIRSLVNEVDSDYLRDYNRFGLFPLLSPNSKELIVEQYSGGAHCCTSYRFYELGSEPLLLYDSDDYPVGYEPFFTDLDADGVYEFSQPLLTFDYFDSCSHADSAFPVAIFNFDAKSRRYKPANRAFAREILKELPRYEKELNEFRKAHKPSEEVPVHGEYLGKVLQVLVTYLYAGKIQQGWAFFEREYQLPDKAKIRQEIEDELAKDTVYLAVAKQ